jgi:phosphatidylserine synthase
MNYKRVLRYLAPNLITTASITFGMLALSEILRANYQMAAWYVIYATFTDRLDGLVARAVRGSSEFGVQLDSFADFLNFGVVPAYLIYASLGHSELLPFREGASHYLLMAGCGFWVLAAAFRLARYNITEEVPGPVRMGIFFGVPTTLAAGTLMIWYLALYKYAAPGEVFPLLDQPYGGARLVDFETPIGVWRYMPVVMFIGAYLMMSSLRMPKLGLMRSRLATVVVLTIAISGVTCGVLRIFPEYMMWMPTTWVVTFLLWGQLSPAARAMRPPPVFPSVDPPPGKEPVRPEDDHLPEGADADLDGGSASRSQHGAS